MFEFPPQGPRGRIRPVPGARLGPSSPLWRRALFASAGQARITLGQAANRNHAALPVTYVTPQTGPDSYPSVHDFSSQTQDIPVIFALLASFVALDLGFAAVVAGHCLGQAAQPTRPPSN